MATEIIQGRFEQKPRNKALNDTLRNSRSEAHEPKAGEGQKRSRIQRKFKNAVNEWLTSGEEDFCLDDF